MTLAQLIPFAINASMFLIVLALGLHADMRDATYLFRRPGLLARSILSMNVIMLALALIVVVLFELHPAIDIALVALAVSPVPPILPGKEMKAGGSMSYSIGLLVAVAVASIVIVHVAMSLLLSFAGRESQILIGKVTQVVAVSVILPLAIGMVVRRLAPDFAERIAKPLSIFASALLGVAIVPVLFTAWPAISSLIGNGVILILALFTLVGTLIGHYLGGPEPDHRTVLALSTGTRHPGVASAIASPDFPEEKLVLAVILLHLIVSAIVSIPYVNWRTRRHAGAQRRTK